MMEIFVEKINESFIKINTSDNNIIEQLHHHFSFFNENYKFKPFNQKTYLFNRNNLFLPIGLYSHLNLFFKKNKINFKFDENISRKIIIPDKKIKKFILDEKEKFKTFKPRFYQIKSLYLALQNNKSIIELPTGSGKSFIIFLYIKFLMTNYLDKKDKILLIVPKKSLVFQMRDEFENYQKDFSYKIHTICAGQEKTSIKQIHISTWQSIYKLPYNHFKQYKTLIIDECHTAKANSIRKITEYCTNTKFRLGTTATIPNNVYKIILLGNFEKIYQNIEKTKDLINKKLLSNVIIHHIILKHPIETRLLVSSFPQKDFNNEIILSLRNINRFKIILNIIQRLNKNCLILFKRISFGKKLYNTLLNMNLDRTIYYIDGKIDIEKREEMRKKMEEKNNIILIATHQIFSMGINIKNLHYIIITLFNKSKISVMQTIGRGLRPLKNKKIINIIDLVDDMQINNKEKKEYEKNDIILHTNRNLLLQHFYDRLKIYKEEGFEYKIIRKEL